MSRITDLPVTPITAQRDETDTGNRFVVAVDLHETAVALQRGLDAQAMLATLSQDVADRDEALERASEQADGLRAAVGHLTTGLSVQRQSNITLLHALRLTVAAIRLGLSEPDQWAVRALRHAGAGVPDDEEARALLGAVAGDSVVLGGEGR